MSGLLLITEFDAPDREFCWRDEREVDAQKAASVAQIYVTNGIKTVNEARSDLGLDPVAGGWQAYGYRGWSEADDVSHTAFWGRDE